MSAEPATTATIPAPSAFSRLFAAACGAHAGDQLALAALPLTAVLVLGADAATVGMLVAAQGAAWLVGSLPAGILVDRLSRRSVLAGSQALAAVGFALATAMALAGSVPLLGLSAFVAALGTVAFALGVNAMVPDLVGRAALSRANGRIEVARALVTLAAPVAVGAMARHATPTLAYAAAACAAALACIAALALPRTAPPPARDRALGTEIAEGFNPKVWGGVAREGCRPHQPTNCKLQKELLTIAHRCRRCRRNCHTQLSRIQKTVFIHAVVTIF